jgi:hypothetical protein
MVYCDGNCDGLIHIAIVIRLWHLEKIQLFLILLLWHLGKFSKMEYGE